MMKCVDLFAGCGGLSLGFQLAGFEIIRAFDCLKPAIEVYEKKISHPVTEFDLTNDSYAITSIAKIKPDLIMGGPPCQDFSSAGKRDTSLGRASLTHNFANIVCGVSR